MLARAKYQGQLFQFTTSHGGRPGISTILSITLPFNSRPHTEVDDGSCKCLYRICLSIHDLTRRSTWLRDLYMNAPSFQFTTSHGGRRDEECTVSDAVVFQFTTSHGGRRLRMDMRLWYTPFNSRPHTEVD